MERIAERAGTSRAVIYRRWQSRPELVIAALRRHRPVVPGRVPDTGTLRGDMLAVLSRVSSRLSAIGPTPSSGFWATYSPTRRHSTTSTTSSYAVAPRS